VTDMPDAIKPERVTMAVACAITGKKPRSLRGMCLAGQVPGAAKLGGEWTFNEAQLRAWIDDLEQQPASTRVRKRRPTPPPLEIADTNKRFGSCSGNIEAVGST
jgi:hypothetical protein